MPYCKIHRALYEGKECPQCAAERSKAKMIHPTPAY